MNIPRWQSLLGNFEEEDCSICFRGGEVKQDGQSFASVGNLIFETRFSGGRFSADVIFSDADFSDATNPAACELILSYDPSRKTFVTAGLGCGPAFAVRSFQGERWIYHGEAGERTNLKPNRSYRVEVILKGSWVVLTVDGVDVVSTNLSFPIPRNQVGIWCVGKKDIKVQNVNIEEEEGRAFVVMQFSQPYDDVYSEVIKKVCKEFNLKPYRGDDTYGPGLIIADIVDEILRSKLVIAEISPSNPNVYYEVGYAHAVNKPTILVAERGTKLPFDVAAFRTLFYENSIGGKTRFEEGLRKHVGAIMRDWYRT